MPATNLQLALSRTDSSPEVDPSFGALEATKANLVIAINNLMVLSGGKGERLYFYFAGHGLTTRVSNRDESAAARDRLHEHQHRPVPRAAVAVGVLRDDAVRRPVPVRRRVPQRAAVGRRRRVRARPLDAAAQPRPGHAAGAAVHPLRHLAEAAAAEIRDTPGQEHGAFTAALLEGLRGGGAAKAWSWQRQCYEVRWERLADYVKRRVESEARKVGGSPRTRRSRSRRTPAAAAVAGRDRDALLTSFPAETFDNETARSRPRSGQRVSRRGRPRAEPARRRRRGADRVHGPRRPSSSHPARTRCARPRPRSARAAPRSRSSCTRR